MLALDADIARRIIGSLGVIAAYGLSLWHIFKRSPGDTFIQSASITVMVFVVTMAAMRIHYFPDWVLGSLELLLGVLTFVSIFFMFQEGYRALRRRRAR